MRMLLLFGLVSSLIAASGCADARDAPVAKTVQGERPLTPGSGAIEGYVVDDELSPLQGSVVTIVGLDLRLRTDAEGYFYAGPLKPGAYRLVASRDGFEPDAVKANVADDRTELVVFVLQGIPAADAYQSVQVQRGFVACAVTVAPNTLLQADVANAAMDIECGAPRTGGEDQHAEQASVQLETQDRSQRRWTLDAPDASWESGVLETRWLAGHELARQFATFLAVDGCTDEERSFGRALGPSPIRHELASERVDQVLARAEGTTCAVPGERCDSTFCVLTSRARPAARDLGPPIVRVGAAVQQVFEQELTATFRVQEDDFGQTLK